MKDENISNMFDKILKTMIRDALSRLEQRKTSINIDLSLMNIVIFFWYFMIFSIYLSLLKGLRYMNRFTAYMRIEILDQLVMNLDASLNSSWTWGNRMIVSFFLLNTTTQILQYYSHELENVAFCILVTNLKIFLYVFAIYVVVQKLM